MAGTNRTKIAATVNSLRMIFFLSNPPAAFALCAATWKLYPKIDDVQLPRSCFPETW